MSELSPLPLREGLLAGLRGGADGEELKLMVFGRKLGEVSSSSESGFLERHGALGQPLDLQRDHESGHFELAASWLRVCN